MNTLEIKKRLINIIMESVEEIGEEEIGEEDIAKDSNLVDELGFSSIDIIRLVVQIENEFNIEIEDENLNFDSLSTYSNLYNIVLHELSKHK